MKYAFLFLVTALTAQDITGFWKSVDEKTGEARCIVAIYEYEDSYFGRIIATYDGATHKIAETIYSAKSRAPGIIGNPYYCGLDFIYNLTESGPSYRGKIVDPQKGNVYNAEVWVDDNGNLVVRGKLLMFGRNQTWPPAEDKDFPHKFKIPSLDSLVPKIPEVK